MVTVHNEGYFLENGRLIAASQSARIPAEGKKRTISYGILQAHNTSGDPERLRIRFDAMASHDITYLPGTQAKGQVADNAVLGHLNASRLGHCIESGIHDSITSSRDRQTLEVTGFINSLVGGIIRGGKAIQIRSRHTLLKRNAVFAGSAQRHFCVVCQRHSGQRENHDQCHQQRQDLCCFLHCSNSFFSKFFCEPRPFHRTPYSFSPVKKRNPLGFRHEALRCKRGLVCGNVTISAPPLLQELLYNLISEHSRSNLVKFQKISVLPNKRFVSHYRP